MDNKFNINTENCQLDLLRQEVQDAVKDYQTRFDYLLKKLDTIAKEYESEKKSSIIIPSEITASKTDIVKNISIDTEIITPEEITKAVKTVEYKYKDEVTDNIKRTIHMDSVCSQEFYEYPDGNVKQVLRNISLDAYEGQILGIIGNHTFEIKLLLEIMANVKPYASGKCILVERGMMRKKRIIVPHIFYIGSTSMLFNNMNVLEYLMFVTGKTDINPVDRQENFINLLIELKLSHLTLVPISYLKKQEQAVILLLAATFSESSKLIFLNLPHIEFGEKLQKAILGIASIIRENKKTMIISTQETDLIDRVCTHTAVIANGQMEFAGCIKRLYDEHDKLVFIIEISNAQEIAENIKKELPEYSIELIFNRIYLYDYNDIGIKFTSIATVLDKYDVEPDMIRRVSKATKNSYREMMRKYDL